MTGGEIRASDADRDQVSEVLQMAYAEGRITSDELGERTAAAVQARTFDDLVPLTADLLPAPAPQPTRFPVNTGPAVPTGSPERMVSVLSSTKRVGPWRVNRFNSATACLGDVLIDLTEATFDSPVVEVNCSQFLGSIKVRVPLGTNVILEAVNIAAGSSAKGFGPPDPEMPTVIIKGVNILGDIQVRGPKKPLPWKRHVA
ncbi:MAG TPA: DUF1707 domain-containing protein [Propionibacteriaceae bacterium]